MQATYLILIAFLYASLLMGCSPNDHQITSNLDEKTMTSVTLVAIVGKWHKLSPAECDTPYPDQLEFLKAGVYLSTPAEKAFTLWQSGDYELVDGDRIKIQTATDAMLLYRVSLQNDKTLVFIDEKGCEFKYQRAPHARSLRL